MPMLSTRALMMVPGPVGAEILTLFVACPDSSHFRSNTFQSAHASPSGHFVTWFMNCAKFEEIFDIC